MNVHKHDIQLINITLTPKEAREFSSKIINAWENGGVVPDIAKILADKIKEQL